MYVTKRGQIWTSLENKRWNRYAEGMLGKLQVKRFRDSYHPADGYIYNRKGI